MGGWGRYLNQYTRFQLLPYLVHELRSRLCFSLCDLVHVVSSLTVSVSVKGDSSLYLYFGRGLRIEMMQTYTVIHGQYMGRAFNIVLLFPLLYCNLNLKVISEFLFTDFPNQFCVSSVLL